MKEPEKLVVDIDDFEHKVREHIDFCKDIDGSPKMENYDFTKDEFEDYLFDKQAILDMEGSKRTQYTVAGTLIVLPVIIVSAIPVDNLPYRQWILLLSILLGLLVFLFVKSLLKMIISVRLKKMSNPAIDKYIRDIDFFYNSHQK